MALKFLGDENFDARIAAAINASLGDRFDFQSAVDADILGKNDDLVLAVAANCGRVLLTHDARTMLRFLRAFSEKADSPGVVVIRRSSSLSAAIESLEIVVEVGRESDFHNRVEFLPL